MARFYVWTKGQVLAALAGALLLTALGAVGLTLLFSDGQPSAPQEGEAQMVFAEAELLYTVETPPPVVDTSLRVEVVRSTQQPPMAGKQVLIYHTHTWEAFEQVENARYVETEKWRSKDNAANMVAVGDALTAALEALGCTVVHDETAFEPPDLSTAYQRSLEMLEARLAAGESYDLYIDLHRDAVASNSTIKRTVNVAGEELARFMVLVGKGQSYAEKPDWQANYAVAEKITASLNHQVEGLCRDVKVKTGRFNQHIAPRCVLIECGLNYNTLEQVLNGVPYLAQAICDSLAE
ncbi:MAG: stage II sporulation protein P [Clostridia bacterium]|nr:stage II sporulation protein P [Clostridia bacterium]